MNICKEMDGSKDGIAHYMAADTTKYYADSVEWCPFENLSNFFVCGTYQLDEESSSEFQVRRGNLVLYKLSSVQGSCSVPAFQLSIIESVLTSGILDMKWCSHRLYNKTVIALVCSDGKILLKCLNESKSGISLSDLTFHDVAEEENKMVLSVDWSCENENSASIVASDTKGFLNYINVGEADLSLLNSWKAHDFESWITAFNYNDPNIIYSGGDDCCFKSWDVRSLTSSIFVKKRHSMGVTAIAKSKLNENLLVTGSYDENIFLWDVRNMKSTLSEISVHGGVWRLKWHPTNPTYLLSASMHNGFHVLSLNCNQLELQLLYDKHKSLAYGVDWSHISSASSSLDTNQDLLNDLDKCNIKNIIASCSFYDNLLHVWGINF